MPDHAPQPDERETLRFRRIVVIGGGCYGSWYTQQLDRAAAKGRLVADEVVVVDRNPACRVAARAAAGDYATLPLRVERTTWADYCATWLGTGPDALARDAMVPSPLMPHLCLDWLLSRLVTRWPHRAVRVEPLDTTPPTPWERAAPDGRHYVSFATWTCPVNCIEPARCPATRDVRDWSMPAAMTTFAEREPTLGRAVIFPCIHRTHGVGMIDAAPIAAAESRVAAWAEGASARVLVGTVSHCHGALGVLAID
ncbi:MAG: hypothetical protein LCH84_12535 [Gemmatimonadetes bacterium]|nr:hypothetical protein [Gemmatimonadota bacterium]